MTIALRDRGIAAVLLDIEGTTTPIAFVHDTLFPFARAHMAAYVRDPANFTQIREVGRVLAEEHAADVSAGAEPPVWRADSLDEIRESVESYVHWLMDRDRKSHGLKKLQGWVWERGYCAGLLKGDVFPEVPAAIRRWRAAGLDVAIYSSGSVLAQKLLFGSAPGGDLTVVLNGFFDTAVGPKTAPRSYGAIVETLHRTPATVIFVSDVTAELSAARIAGLQVALSIRPGNHPQPDAETFEQIQSLDELV